MRKKFKSLAGISLIATATTSWAFNDGHYTTASFGDVLHVIEDKVHTYGADRVLIALDIDNTTLAFEKDFGSEHWAMWQSQMISDRNFGQGAVTRTLDGMFNIQSQIVFLSPMRPVEPEIPNELKKLGQRGVQMLALTSRGLSTHDATLRELRRNGFPYENFAPGPKHGFAGSYSPMDLSHPELSGLSPQDVKNLNLVNVGSVMYQDGTFLTEGQHKGAMLRTLLHKLHSQFDAIIFVDDRAKHSEGMQAAFKDRTEAVTTIQYARNAKVIADWHSGDKTVTKQDWCEFSRAILATHGNPGDANMIPCL